MRKLIIALDEDLDPWLATKFNQSETVREALRLYKGDIPEELDTLDGIRRSYKNLLAYMENKFLYYDEVFARLDKLINVLETRM